ncbi:glycyl-tRNA synthetase [Paraphysoderma sedebokerense]|nr:glycyl-tRNA synthetase [Paraphysoderma sedebokerense]
MASTHPHYSRILTLLKRRGFLFPSAHIYGGLRGSYDLGPLGAELKRQISAAWWTDIVHGHSDIHGVDTSILTHHSVLEASGHVENFTDLLVDDKLSSARFRADKGGIMEVGEEKNGMKYVPVVAEDKEMAKGWLRTIRDLVGDSAKIERSGTTIKLFVKEIVNPVITEDTKEGEVDKVGKLVLMSEGDSSKIANIEYRGYVNPLNNSPFLTSPRPFNLLFKTFIDPIDPIEKIIQTTLSLSSPNSTVSPSLIRSEVDKILKSSTAYLRPETAQGVYISFPYILKTLQLTPPFGIAQIGKSFRNEIRTESLLYRTFEFEQMELQYFVNPESSESWYNSWVQKRFDWWNRHASNVSNWRLRKHDGKELAHYAKGCTDIEFKFPWGWGEIEGVANRGDFDLRRHGELAKVSMEVSHRSGEQLQRYTPYVIESSSGLSRAVLAYLCDAFTEETKTTLTSLPNSTISPSAIPTSRTLLRLHPRFAPVKVSVLPLVTNNAEVKALTGSVDALLRSTGLPITSDLSGASIGKKYARADEIGVPVCVTIDHQSSEDGCVTVRTRDTMSQKRVKIPELCGTVNELMNVWKS